MVSMEEKSHSLTRLGAWMAVVLILIASLLLALNSVSQHAQSTSVALIGKKTLDKANYLRQHWELSGKPKYAEVDDHVLVFNNKGWPEPILNGIKSCSAWQMFLIAHSERPNPPIASRLVQQSDLYRCQYDFESGETLNVELNRNDLSIYVLNK